MIQAVQQARDRFVICELGAGWGKWCVRAVCALRQLNPLPFACIAVEAEPTHFRWLRQHFADNGIDPDDHDLRWAALRQPEVLSRSRPAMPDRGTASRSWKAGQRRRMPALSVA